MKFRIQWVGEKVYEKDGTKEYSIAVIDEDGREQRKGIKLVRSSTVPPPAVDEVIEGNKTPHPKFDNAFVIEEGAAGVVGEAQSSKAVSAPAATSDHPDDPRAKQASIEAQSAVKAAGEAASSPGDLAERTLAGYRAIQECKREALEPDGGAAEGKAEDQTDDDIPF